MFGNNYVDIDPDDPDPDEESKGVYDLLIYGKDIKVVKFTRTDADIEEALDNIKMKAQAKKFNI